VSDVFRKYSKAFLAALGGLTPAAVVGILALFHVQLDSGTVGTLLGVLAPLLATLATIVGPANQPQLPSDPSS
jgi:hypothetical protein